MQGAALTADTLYAARVTAWGVSERFPNAVIEQTLGAVGERAAESAAILVDHAVSTAPFTEEACDSLPSEGWVPSAPDVATRLDLREGLVGESICSVDPPGCVDIDDALHAIELPRADDGSRRFEVGVHIADVSHFIKAGQALDSEAAARGTTFYLVDQRVNMVPTVLSENVGSLHASVDRLAFSVLFEMDERATILSSRLVKTLIRSRAALSYAEAQARIDSSAALAREHGAVDPAVAGGAGCTTDGGADDPLTRSLSTLNALARQLSAARVEAGALRLASPEVKFAIEATSDHMDMTTYTPLEANSMIEEFMLLANVTAAKLILEHFPQTALLRRHPVPNRADFGFLHTALEQHGLTLDLSSPKALASSLDTCEKADEPDFNMLVRYMAVRAMPAAEYVVAGKVEAAGGSYAHFGLASPVYAHFTSPIRRYADQVVHRMAAVAIGIEPPSPELSNGEAMSTLAETLNERHSAAKDAERASVSLYSLFYFRDAPVVESGYCTRATQKGVAVLIPRFGIESWIFASSSPGTESPLAWDAKSHALTAPCVRCWLDPRARSVLAASMRILGAPRATGDQSTFTRTRARALHDLIQTAPPVPAHLGFAGASGCARSTRSMCASAWIPRGMQPTTRSCAAVVQPPHMAARLSPHAARWPHRWPLSVCCFAGPVLWAGCIHGCAWSCWMLRGGRCSRG